MAHRITRFGRQWDHTARPFRWTFKAILSSDKWVPNLWDSALVAVGDGELLGGKERDDLGALGRHDHLFLDASGRDAVGSRAVRLDGEDHPLLELHGVVERVQA